MCNAAVSLVNCACGSLCRGCQVACHNLFFRKSSRVRNGPIQNRGFERGYCARARGDFQKNFCDKQPEILCTEVVRLLFNLHVPNRMGTFCD